MQIRNLCSNIIMVFRLDFKVFQALQKATLTDCLFCMTKLFLLMPLIMLLYPGSIVMDINQIKENKLKFILQFSIPSIISMLLQTAITITDAFFTGNYVGENAL